MRRHTDAYVKATLDADLTGCKYRLSLKGQSQTVVKTQDDCSTDVSGGVSTISCWLDVDETSGFRAGESVTGQLNWVDAEGRRHASGMDSFRVSQNQDEGDIA